MDFVYCERALNIMNGRGTSWLDLEIIIRSVNFIGISKKE
jgi:DMSO reductase anchor subunit